MANHNQSVIDIALNLKLSVYNDMEQYESKNAYEDDEKTELLHEIADQIAGDACNLPASEIDRLLLEFGQRAIDIFDNEGVVVENEWRQQAMLHFVIRNMVFEIISYQDYLVWKASLGNNFGE